MVEALRPVSSLRRLAARPVGAQRATRSAWLSSTFSTALTVVVLPVPGPPVSTRQFSVTAWRMASRCSGA